MPRESDNNDGERVGGRTKKRWSDNNDRETGKRGERQAQIPRDSIFLIQISCGNSSSVSSRE